MKSERPWCTCANAKNAPERDCPVHVEMYQTPAVRKYEQQMQAAFEAESEHRDCSCSDEVNPFCKTHTA